MAEQQDSSVLFNLKALMSLEKERIAAEIDAKRQAEEQARAAVEAERQRLAALEVSRVRAIAEARAEQERRKAHEIERLELAKRDAELRLRLEHDAKERAEQQERLLTHEREMLSIRAQAKKSIHPAALGGVVVLVLGVGFALYQGVIAPQIAEYARDRDRAQALLDASTRTAHLAHAELETARMRHERELQALRTAAARAELERLKLLQPAPQTPTKNVIRHVTPTPHHTPGTQNNDPLFGDENDSLRDLDLDGPTSRGGRGSR